jgi:hypothetical protein
VGRLGKTANRECPSAFGTLPCVGQDGRGALGIWVSLALVDGLA